MGTTRDNPKAARTDPVLVLHAAGLDAGSARFLELPGVVTASLPGHGDRRPARPGLSLEDMVDEIVGWVDRPVHVVGLSLGGMVAQHLAIAHPERVRSLVLACTSADTDEQLLMDRARSTECSSRQELVETTMARWFTAGALQEHPLAEPVAYARECLRRIDQEGYAQIWRAIGGHDARPGLSRITVPTTCIAGSHDVATPPAVVAALADALPNGRLVTIDAPHMAPLEQPGRFREAVLDHLAWVEAGSPRVP